MYWTEIAISISRVEIKITNLINRYDNIFNDLKMTLNVTNYRGQLT